MKWWKYEMIWNALLFSSHAEFYSLLRSLSERLPCDGDFCTFCPEVICCCTGVTVDFFLNPSQSIQIETCVNRQQTNEARARHASRRFWTYTSRQNFRATHARPVLQHRPLETCAFLMLLWNTSKLRLANTWKLQNGFFGMCWRCLNLTGHLVSLNRKMATVGRTTLTCIDLQPYCILKSWRKMKLGLFVIFHNNCALALLSRDPTQIRTSESRNLNILAIPTIDNTW